MIEDGSYTKFPCGKCEYWIEIDDHDTNLKTFVFHTSHDHPESCEHFRFVQEQNLKLNHPTLVIDTREKGERR